MLYRKVIKTGADSITLKNIQGETALAIARKVAKVACFVYKREAYRKIATILAVSTSARQKLYKLRKQAAKKYAAQYPGTPIQEIIKYLK